jgi:hypothetical protein
MRSMDTAIEDLHLPYPLAELTEWTSFSRETRLDILGLADT